MAERAQKPTPPAATVLSDPREVDAIYFNDRDGTRYSRRAGYVIEAYAEDGPKCLLAFYRVIRDGVLIARVPAWQVEVCYVTT